MIHKTLYSNFHSCWMCVAICLALTQVGRALEPTPGFLSSGALEQKGFLPLFDGTDLDAWEVEAGHVGHWVVRDGMIDYDGKAEAKNNLKKGLWTREAFGDVRFYVEWRLSGVPKIKQHPVVMWNGDFLRDHRGDRITRPMMDAGDSGILFRGILDCQVNIWSQEMGSGEINGFRVNKDLPVLVRRSCIPFIKADRPFGEWNVFLITLQNDRMIVQLNGQEVLRSESLPGLPPKGPIGLQHHGDRIQFRNIWVKSLP